MMSGETPQVNSFSFIFVWDEIFICSFYYFLLSFIPVEGRQYVLCVYMYVCLYDSFYVELN